LISIFYKMICIITPTFQHGIIRDGTFIRPCYRWTDAIADVIVVTHVTSCNWQRLWGSAPFSFTDVIVDASLHSIWLPLPPFSEQIDPSRPLCLFCS